MLKLFVFSILFLSTIALFAQIDQPELIGDRPDMTESAFTIPKGHLQLETGFDYSSISKNINEITYHSTLLRYGIFKNAELRLGFANTALKIYDVTSQSMPFYVGTKIHLMESKGNAPQIALIVATGIESLDDATGSSTVDYTPGAILACENSLTSNLSIGYNLGIEYSSVDEAISGIVSAALGIGVGENSGIFVEGAWFPSSLSKDARFNTGFTHQFTPAFQFDVYGGLGLLEDSPEYNTGLGVIFLF